MQYFETSTGELWGSILGMEDVTGFLSCFERAICENLHIPLAFTTSRKIRQIIPRKNCYSDKYCS